MVLSACTLFLFFSGHCSGGAVEQTEDVVEASCSSLEDCLVAEGPSVLQTDSRKGQVNVEMPQEQLPPIQRSTNKKTQNAAKRHEAHLPGLLQKVEQDSCPTVVVVEGAESLRPVAMGVFEEQTGKSSPTQNAGRPVYKNTNDLYMYYWAEHSCWMIGPANASCWMHSAVGKASEDALCAQDSSGWKAWDGSAWTSYDIDVRQSTATTTTTSELELDVDSCPTAVVVEGAESLRPIAMGVFEEQTGKSSPTHNAGRPVYKNSNDLYMYYWAEHSCWMIGPANTSCWMHSAVGTASEDALCAQDSSGWKAWDGSAWTMYEIDVRQSTTTNATTPAVTTTTTTKITTPTTTTTTIITITTTTTTTAATTTKTTTNTTTRATKTTTATTRTTTTTAPTAAQTPLPTAAPTRKPSAAPTTQPTAAPSVQPTAMPTPQPTATPTSTPSHAPTAKPTAIPSASPTSVPTPLPTNESEPEPEPEAASSGPTPAPTSEEAACVDSDSCLVGHWGRGRGYSCARYAGYCGSRSVMRQCCPKSCNVCQAAGSPAPAPTPTASCVDSDSCLVGKWGRGRGYSCTRYAGYCGSRAVMRQCCPKSCNVCQAVGSPAPAPTPAASCVDSDSCLVGKWGGGRGYSCARYAGYCRSRAVMRQCCPRSCNVCQASR